jgi:40-residue YVTN family beta-propeller repeat
VTNEITNTIQLSGKYGSPFGIAVSPDGNRGYVSNWDQVSVIDTNSNSVISNILTGGNNTFGISVTPDGKRVYAANSFSHTVSVIDTATNTVISTVPVGKYPQAFGSFISSGNFVPIRPVADFTSNVTSGKAPVTVAFTDKSLGMPTSWDWNFGDGATSTDKNPVHTYSTTGNYTVNLTASNENGIDSKLATIIVTEKSLLPVADFSASVTSGNAPLEVAYSDESIGSPTKWKWTFGDGKTSTIQNPTHKYSKAGSYTVSLTATNAEGSNTTTKIDYIKVIEKPVADFTSNVTSGKAPLTVAFKDKSKGIPTSWKWTFGDGAESSVQNPIYQYSQEGKYKVTLTVTNAAGGSTATKTNYIKVTTNTRPGLYSKSK